MALNGSFLSSLVGGSIAFLIFIKGGNIKKKLWENLIYTKEQCTYKIIFERFL